MADEPATVTAIKALQRDQHIRSAMHRLLDKLKEWVRVYPISPEVEVPDHDIRWAAGIGAEGPDRIVFEAMKATPALWMSALPEGLVIVSRDRLEQVSGLTPTLVDYLVMDADNQIHVQAARMQQEEMEAEYRKRWGRRELT